MIERILLDRLKQAQAEHALEALKRPSTCDSFEYGRQVGIVAGYEKSINLLLSVINEETYGEKDI